MLEQSLRRAFIDYRVTGSHYDPKLIINRPEKKEFLLNTIQDELSTCQSFVFSIAFITQDGLNGLKTYLADLDRQGISGRLITSTYLSFNHPDVFESLLRIPNLEVRLSQKKGFHAKGYLFNHGDYQAFIIGSSNLTMSAMKINYEWNVRLSSYDHGEMVHQMHNHLEEQWAEGIELTREWIKVYRQTFNPPKFEKPVLAEVQADYIVPNKMQQSALEGIQSLRDQGEERGLVISATGTGKTYLAAFDVLNAQPDRMLFIVHREQILKDAMRSFQKVIGGPDSDYGILSGHRKDLDAKYLFATIQTISKPDYQAKFARDAFDYILIDEVHKAGAISYRRTIDYFEPDFLLGLTATPERTDDINIFELFDYNVAYEIRLQEALEEDLLSPFHYFGVTDYEKDGQTIDETTGLKYLVAEERVEFLLDRLHYYGVSHNQVKGLVFCSRKEEAKQLSQAFNQAGVVSSYLTGDHSIAQRETEVARLEEGEISYIFTVDIFNEGIDIPKINQVVMLRNTQSSIIFIQQMGRGLRKHTSKDFVTIVDFIGNYKNNYLIPMSLSGDISRNRNALRKDTADTNYISGLSSINFEQVAKERIFEAIDQAKMDSMATLREAYTGLKDRLNRVPRLVDFKQTRTLDPAIIANKKDNYYAFLEKMEGWDSLTERENKILTFLTREVLPGKRLHEIILLDYFTAHPDETLSFRDLVSLWSNQGLATDPWLVDSVLNTLTTEFYTGQSRKTFFPGQVISVKKGRVSLFNPYHQALDKDQFSDQVEDIIETAKLNNLEYASDQALTLNKKYTRREVIRFLGWQEQMVDQNIGGYAYNKDRQQFVIFVTLEKGDDFEGSLVAYEDAFLDSKTLHWFTKSKRSLTSPEVQILSDTKEWDVHLFVKKSDDEGTDFYYLGLIDPLVESFNETQKKSSQDKMVSLVEMELQLEYAVEHRLYHYLTH